jgi:hypothetical protein
MKKGWVWHEEILFRVTQALGKTRTKWQARRDAPERTRMRKRGKARPDMFGGTIEQTPPREIHKTVT